jgi:hypothetical protein
MTDTLDSFQSELLGELRAVAAARAATTEPAPASGRRARAWQRLTPRRVRVASLAAAAVGVAAAVAVPGLVGSPAYAVTEGPSGTIEVQVNRLQEAAGLETALRDHGVQADIQYLGRDMRCAQPRFAGAASAPDSATRFRVGQRGIEITLDRRDVAHGETVVIAASNITNNGVYGEVGIAAGPVAPCRARPLPSEQR